MDLQAALSSGKRLSLAKLLTVLCFALACGLLIGSLTAAHKAKAGTNLMGHVTALHPPAIKT